MAIGQYSHLPPDGAVAECDQIGFLHADAVGAYDPDCFELGLAGTQCCTTQILSPTAVLIGQHLDSIHSTASKSEHRRGSCFWTITDCVCQSQLCFVCENYWVHPSLPKNGGITDSLTGLTGRAGPKVTLQNIF